MRTILLIALAVFQSASIFGQNFKFGFYAEAIRSASIIHAKGSGGQYDEIECVPRFGFGLGAGIIVNDSSPTSLRLMTGLGYVNEITRFRMASGSEQMKRVSIFFKMPIHLVFRFGEDSNIGLVAGFTPSLGLAGGRDGNDYFNFKAVDICGDVGLNYNIRIKSISIRPEIRYSYSFINGLADNSGELYFDSIDKYLRNRFTLTVLLIK